MLARLVCYALAAVALAPAQLKAFDLAAARAFVNQHCADCHAGGERKGGFALESLAATLDSPESTHVWSRVVARVDSREMPPADAEALAAEHADALTVFLKNEFAAVASRHRRVAGRTRSRRLTRLEYENTVRDLLRLNLPGTQLDLKSLLPDDTKVDGFDTVEAGLSISPVHVQRYLAAAEVALDAATVHLPRPETKHQRFVYTPENELLDHANNKPHILIKDNVLNFFGETHPGVPAVLKQFDKVTRKLPGRYKVRVTMSAFNADVPRVPFALRTTRPAPNLIGYYDALPGSPQVIEFTRQFGPDESFGVYPYRLGYTREELGIGRYDQTKAWTGPGLCVHAVDVEGPLVEAWPPESHRGLLGDLAFKRVGEFPADVYVPLKWSHVGWENVGAAAVTVEMPENPIATAQELLAAFLPRAWRRPVEADSIEPYLLLMAERLGDRYCFEEAMMVAYRAILTSPEFLFIDTPLAEAQTAALDDHALACRLSYLLWRSMPDDELRAVADRGELHRDEVLRAQTERMLNSPRLQAFIEDFTGQWLGLHNIDATTPDKILYPDFFEKTSGDDTAIDGLLRESLLAETRLFVGDLIAKDLGVGTLVESDFTYLNDRLAKHYGIGGVEGLEMRRVALQPADHRGGVLTHASVLKVTANGTTTSPVLRGKWVLENLVGRPPAPPPPNAGSIEPDIRGAKTIREQLEKHQRVETCAGCHRYIDPPGFALEAYDPVGLFRTYYRGTQDGELVDAVYNGSDKVLYHRGPTVEVGGELPDGRKFATTREYQRLLVDQTPSIARCVASKLVTFGTGVAPEAGDWQAIDNIAAATANKQYGMRSLLHAVVQSALFRER